MFAEIGTSQKQSTRTRSVTVTFRQRTGERSTRAYPSIWSDVACVAQGIASAIIAEPVNTATGASMTAEIVNLKRVRKAKARADRGATAAVNRAAFGRTKADRESDAATAAMHARVLDGARRTQPPAVGQPLPAAANQGGFPSTACERASDLGDDDLDPGNVS
jgi:hypothetical protein